MEFPKPFPLAESGKYALDTEYIWKLRGYDEENLSNLPKFSNFPVICSFPQPNSENELRLYIEKLLQRKMPEPCINSDVTFDSTFECGNLESVHQKSFNEFDLILKNDTNTIRHTHWFMFKVFKQSPGSIKLNILNYMKRKSVVSKGMSPFLSTSKCGQVEVRNLRYSKTFESCKKFFTVSFEIDFSEPNDCATVSLTRPYSYSDLLALFQDIEPDNSTPKSLISSNLYYKREVLCESLGSIPIYLITITSRDSKKHKKGAIVTSRVHPSETVASQVVDSFIRFLMGNSEQAESLRKRFIFKIIPMLNPDGVILGNSRTSISGIDMNRAWIDPAANTTPCIYFTKQYIQKFTKKRETLIYLDLHGHSKKLGTFIYGCNKVVNGSFTSWTKVRLYPRILAKNTVMFNYNNCAFSIHPRKEGTGRVVVWKEIGISNSFTIETSIFGYHNGIEFKQYSTENFIQIGEEICKSLLEYTLLLKTLEKELQLTNGWLKPGKFKEISGTPATQLACKKIEKKDLKNEIKKPRTISRTAMARIKEEVLLDWKSYFTQEEIQKAQEKIRLGIESPLIESSSESSSSEYETTEPDQVYVNTEFRVPSPGVEDIGFWVSHPRPMKAVKKEVDPPKCKFIKQHTSDFTGCYLDNYISKRISSDTFRENQRNMFFSRAERTRINKEKLAKARSMSNKREAKNISEIGDYRAVNEKVFKIRPKVQKNYFFAKEKQRILPPALYVNSLRVTPAKRDSLGKL